MREGTQARDLQPSPREPQGGLSPDRGLKSSKDHNKGPRQGLGPGTVSRVVIQRKRQNLHRMREGTEAVKTPTMRLGG